jgi:hypothetical protein
VTEPRRATARKAWSWVRVTAMSSPEFIENACSQAGARFTTQV